MTSLFNHDPSFAYMCPFVSFGANNERLSREQKFGLEVVWGWQQATVASFELVTYYQDSLDTWAQQAKFDQT
jgi:hypothetical protein